MNKLISFLLPLLLAPLLLGIIVRVKAIFAGRVGAPLLQPYYDLYKLMQKDYIYSKTTSIIIRLGPLVIMAIALSLISLLPLGPIEPLWRFEGDILVFVYLLALARFLLIISALDTGSSFAGMGAAREAFFSMLIEPVILFCFLTMIFLSKSTSITSIFSGIQLLWPQMGELFVSLAASMFIVLLLESSRIPFDDPSTHLELTMIHEVMVLDHAGPDLAMILYAQTLKLWIFACFIVQLLLPQQLFPLWLQPLLVILGIVVVTIFIGIIESIMARLKLSRIPGPIIFAFILAFIPFILFFGYKV
ncbi:MAG: NADH-quinone oxidoreductase subunit H [Oligoflexia bacterium]|nr:NADH-quinone oxidoreductase subunit H [Oligoflexia bacterium]MBF0364231.1 NADH-quinone oxidoreductase subunit H [Oligoflexia bacterium]